MPKYNYIVAVDPAEPGSDRTVVRAQINGITVAFLWQKGQLRELSRRREAQFYGEPNRLSIPKEHYAGLLKQVIAVIRSRRLRIAKSGQLELGLEGDVNAHRPMV